MKKDILLYMSDQHSYNLQGYAGNKIVRTPALDRLATEGTSFSNAYTACPLCVPSRAAMISGQLPSNNGVLFNFNSINSDQATFLHSLTVAGYETVLCGRMHFVGPDQRHGYARRIAGDRTPVFANPVPKRSNDQTKVRGFDENSSVYYIGAGDSPVLAYDRYVVEKALAYLKEDHDRPQFLTVGTYGPHFPYVAPKELYEYYYSKVPMWDVRDPGWEHPALDGKMRETDPEVARAARAAYYGLVEQQDRHIGQVYQAFNEYLARMGREGIFIYVSDHGDMNGTRGYYGKQVFYEPSSHVPFVICGAGIPRGKVVSHPVSLLDVGPTVCNLAGSEVLPGDGKSLLPSLTGAEDDSERMTVTEQYAYLSAGGSSMGRMIRWKNWKFFTYSGFPDADVLFDLEKDPDELDNVIEKYPQVAEKMRAAASSYKSYDEIMVHEEWVVRQLRLLMQCDFDDFEERWQCPPIPMVENPVQRKVPFTPTPWVRHMRNKIFGEGNWPKVR